MARITDNPNVLTNPIWAGDFFNREHLIPGGAQLDASQFFAEDSVLVTMTATAVVTATSLVVVALPGAIPDNAIIDFGTNEFARVDGAVAAGATAITVDAIPTEITDTTTGRYLGDGTRKKIANSGLYVGRTIAERDADTGYGPVDDADDEKFLLAFDIQDIARLPDCDLYRHGGIVYEDRLPTAFSLLSGTNQTSMRADYQTSVAPV